MKKLFCVLALAAFPVLLSGCGGQEKFANSNTVVSDSTADKGVADAQSGTVVEPKSELGKYGGKMTDATISDPKTFNYWVSADNGSTGAVGGLYSSLIERNSYTLEWEAGLAELPEVSADNLTWTFHIKPNLKWSDGAPIDADDVIFTLDMLYDEKVQTNMRESLMLDAPDGKDADGKEKYKRVPLQYKKLGPLKVEFKFPVAYAPARSILNFPDCTASQIGKILESRTAQNHRHQSGLGRGYQRQGNCFFRPVDSDRIQVRPAHDVQAQSELLEKRRGRPSFAVSR